MARQHPRTIAYLRVSTSEQDVAKNQTDILLLAHRKQLVHPDVYRQALWHDGGELASLAQAARAHTRPGLTPRPRAVAGSVCHSTM
jgi:DNA invertase Pin-like site-specific DNA recombinase